MILTIAFLVETNGDLV